MVPLTGVLAPSEPNILIFTGDAGVFVNEEKEGVLYSHAAELDSEPVEIAVENPATSELTV